MTIETYKDAFPEPYLPYLAYGEKDGLSEDEARAVDAWVDGWHEYAASVGGKVIDFSPSGDRYFSWSNVVGDLGGMVQDVIITINMED